MIDQIYYEVRRVWVRMMRGLQTSPGLRKI